MTVDELSTTSATEAPPVALEPLPVELEPPPAGVDVAPPGVPLWRVVAALFVAGLAFRGPVLVVGPLLPEIQADLAIPHGVAGLLSSIPVLCMAILAPLGPVLAASIGPTRVVTACLATVAGFGLLRAVAPGAAPVILLTVGIGLGMGVVGPVLAQVVRRAAPRNPELGTGAYAMGYIVGASSTAALAVTLAAVLGGWRGAFAAVSVGAIGSLVAWWLLAPHDGHGRRIALRRPTLPWRRGIAWLFGIVFGIQSLLFHAGVAWLASIYLERGWAAADGALLTALFSGMGIIATLVVPLVTTAIRSRRLQLAAASLAALLGAIGVAAGGGGGPAGDPLAVPSVALFGFGVGLTFPLCLTLPLDASDSPVEASSVAALMLMVGYLISSIGPVLLGSIRDATGDFAIAGWLIAAISVLLLAGTLSLTAHRIHGPPARPA
ncbi:MAG TPA: MFS transporter [Candidatus Limnocylindrales bacterium]|nr:MFS transporter [Candidatus Limnocylindrales bacterium]